MLFVDGLTMDGSDLRVKVVLGTIYGAQQASGYFALWPVSTMR